MSETKVYIKKFHGKHFDIDYRESKEIQIIFPKLNNKDRFIFEIVFDVVPSEEKLRFFIKKIYSELKIINDNLVLMSKKTSIAETLEKINYE